ncbi:MAG: Por secretion system C-terminal sorting protein [Fibrobacteres bacterium]|nr:Por secretion system C-terminal sorting protein [Fibrobacterota bacterium]
MMTANRTRISHFRSRTVIAPLMAVLSMLVLLLGGCQSEDGLTGNRGQNTLATGMAVPLTKFADQNVISGLSTPMAMEFAPDGRLFVLEKSGAVKIVTGPATTVTFLTLTVDQNTERGLLGIAFDPDWNNGVKKVYIHYSVAGGNHNRVSIFSVSASDPNKADPAETILFELDPLTNSAYHNGGALHFGLDNNLYLTTGDNRLTTNGQANNLLGKMLRFSKTPSGTPGIPNIPTDNPFYASQTGKNRAIWAFGLRNPFTFAVQPGTGRIFINDIGENTYEEINEATQGGRNFGWPNSEGPTSEAGKTTPIGGYVNGYTANGGNYNVGDCAIIGAAFYNPKPGAEQYPASYIGDYFFGDHCSQYIKVIDLAAPTAPTTFATALGGLLMDLKVNPFDGALYYLTLNGNVGKISYTGSDAPTIARQPASQLISVNQPVTFSVEANGTNLSYQWQKNGVDIANAKSASYTIPSVTLADNNTTYRVAVKNAVATLMSDAATLTVTSNQRPVPTIAAPASTLKWSAGQTITYSGSATDAEDGTLPATSLSWYVVEVHDAHTHPIEGPKIGAGFSYIIPTSNETAPGISYRFILEAKDSQGLIKRDSVEIKPNQALITLLTSPAGLQVTLDGQPKTSGFGFTGVVGVTRTLGAVSPQTLNGTTYYWSGWSDGKAQTHDISTPSTNSTFTATFGTTPTNIALPGKLQAEDYKAGGEGVGYHDLTAGNTGNVYRADGVDIEASTDVGTGYNVGWTQAGEWLEYSVNVATTGTYNLTARMASGVVGTKTAAVTVDGVAKGTFNLTDARGWQIWNDVPVSGVSLTSGIHTLRITMNTGDFNLNYLNVVSAGGNLVPTANAGADKSVNVNTLVTLDGRGSSDPDNAPSPLTYSWTKLSGPTVALNNATTSQPNFTPSTTGTYVFRLTVSDGAASATDDIQVVVNAVPVGIALPGRLQAEEFKTGGEGVGYHELSATNLGGAYRTAEAVDIEATTDGGPGYDVGWTDAGEWLDYAVNVSTNGAYTLTARLASGNAGTKTVAVTLDGGTTPIATFSFTDASGWQSWKDIVVSGVNLSVGAHTLRFTMTTGGVNFNYVDFAIGTPPANLLQNGDFSNGIVSWTPYFAAPATGTIANEAGAARATITNQGANPWDIQLYQSLALTAGKVYTLDFDIKAEATPKTFRVVVEHNVDPWTKYHDVQYTVTAAANTYQHFTISWTQSAADAAGRVVFDFGFSNVNDVWVDNVFLK